MIAADVCCFSIAGGTPPPKKKSLCGEHTGIIFFKILPKL